MDPEKKEALKKALSEAGLADLLLEHFIESMLGLNACDEGCNTGCSKCCASDSANR